MQFTTTRSKFVFCNINWNIRLRCNLSTFTTQKVIKVSDFYKRIKNKVNTKKDKYLCIKSRFTSWFLCFISNCRCCIVRNPKGPRIELKLRRTSFFSKVPFSTMKISKTRCGKKLHFSVLFHRLYVCNFV